MAGTPTKSEVPVDTSVRYVQRFPCSPASGSAARQFMRRVWPDVSDEVVLATSELAANAIEHAGTEFELCIEFRLDSASVAVRDWAPRAWPRPKTGAALDERGRGLGLVGSLSHRWGWTAACGSKVVWFQV